MNRKTRSITLSALFSALAVVSLALASIWPTGQLGFAAVASLFVAAAVIEMGALYGIYVFVASAALGMLILPDKATPLLYMLFFGFYPIVKSLIERIRSKALQWVLKLLVFNASLSVIWFLVGSLILDFGETSPAILIVYLFGNVIFAIYDYGFTSVVWLYINRISGGKKRR